MLAKAAAKIMKTIRSLDLFSTSQFVNYQGKESYTTFLGGIISLIIYIVIIALGIKMFVSMVNKEVIVPTSLI